MLAITSLLAYGLAFSFFVNWFAQELAQDNLQKKFVVVVSWFHLIPQVTISYNKSN